MRLVVNLTRCQGYGQCAFLAPGVFRMRGGEILLDDPEPGEAERERVLRAVAACPVQAIRVDRIGGGDASGVPAVPASAAAVPPQRTSGGIFVAGGEALRRNGRVVVVGASLAGLAAAVVLRREGFTGSLTMIGDEPCLPYDRPPPSKQALSGWVPPDHTGLPWADDLGVRWLLGIPATGLDLAGRQVRFGDGGTVEYDRLLIATGTRARTWPGNSPART